MGNKKKSWWNEGDEFIDKYERLKRLKESRDDLRGKINDLQSRRIKGIELAGSFFHSSETISIPYKIKGELKQRIIEEMKEGIERLNKRMEKIKREICDEK